MSRYDTMTAAEVLATMGGTMRVLLHRLVAHGFAPWDSQHPSTRDALLTRGLASKVPMGRPVTWWLDATGRGHDVGRLLDEHCQLCTCEAVAAQQPDLFGGDAA